MPLYYYTVSFNPNICSDGAIIAASKHCNRYSAGTESDVQRRSLLCKSENICNDRSPLT